ncbi:hypothetical protein C8F04DRAFT_1248010 [Mycena alexandri]|uniref:Uncharacterized protein n=1 Tax=Mycena alexandri TaxID=1745969 RepID=A0AAD6TI03_9AGAR|nr:hypothetical protein C8F04DRAFT_1248010 [Mycena alexandri]
MSRPKSQSVPSSGHIALLDLDDVTSPDLPGPPKRSGVPTQRRAEAPSPRSPETESKRKRANVETEDEGKVFHWTTAPTNLSCTPGAERNYVRHKKRTPDLRQKFKSDENSASGSNLNGPAKGKRALRLDDDSITRTSHRKPTSDGDASDEDDTDADEDSIEYTAENIQSIAALISLNPNAALPQLHQKGEDETQKFIEAAAEQVPARVWELLKEDVVAEYVVTLMTKPCKGRSDYLRVPSSKSLADLEFGPGRWASVSCPLVGLAFVVSTSLRAAIGQAQVQVWWCWLANLVHDNPKLMKALSRAARQPSQAGLNMLDFSVPWTGQKGPGVYGTTVEITLADGRVIWRFYIGEGAWIEVRLSRHLAVFVETGTTRGNKVNGEVARGHREQPDITKHKGHVLARLSPDTPVTARFMSENILIRLCEAAHPEQEGQNIRTRDTRHGGEALHGTPLAAPKRPRASAKRVGVDVISVVGIYCAAYKLYANLPLPGYQSVLWTRPPFDRFVGRDGAPLKPRVVWDIVGRRHYPDITAHLPHLLPPPLRDNWKKKPGVAAQEAKSKKPRETHVKPAPLPASYAARVLAQRDLEDGIIIDFMH